MILQCIETALLRGVQVVLQPVNDGILTGLRCASIDSAHQPRRRACRGEVPTGLIRHAQTLPGQQCADATHQQSVLGHQSDRFMSRRQLAYDRGNGGLGLALGVGCQQEDRRLGRQRGEGIGARLDGAQRQRWPGNSGFGFSQGLQQRVVNHRQQQHQPRRPCSKKPVRVVDGLQGRPIQRRALQGSLNSVRSVMQPETMARRLDQGLPP
ncbi:MAG: hypothetical protein ACKVQR_22200 [Aquabacterium sp.]